MAAFACLVLWLKPVVILVVLLGTDNIFTQQSLLFSKTALVTVGGAYAVLAYVSQQAVQAYGWITPTDMVTGLGLAETTPGPLIMVVQFVAFLAAYDNPGSLPPMVAGVLGAVLTVWVTFVPCFFFFFFFLNTAFATMNAEQWGPFHANVPDLSSVRWSPVAITVLAAVLIFRFRVATLLVLGICAGLGAVGAVAGR